MLGGTQALARSYFSLLIPRGKEAEYFSFYHAMDRGTSWFGTATFGIVLAITDSYRPALFALIAFFVIGGLLLTRVDTERGHPRGRQRRTRRDLSTADSPHPGRQAPPPGVKLVSPERGRSTP